MGWFNVKADGGAGSSCVNDNAPFLEDSLAISELFNRVQVRISRISEVIKRFADAFTLTRNAELRASRNVAAFRRFFYEMSNSDVPDSDLSGHRLLTFS